MWNEERDVNSCKKRRGVEPKKDRATKGRAIIMNEIAPGPVRC